MTEARRYDRWTPQRTAFAAMLAGRGLTAEEIGANPRVDASAAAVKMQFSRLGLSAAHPRGTGPIRIPAAALAGFVAAGVSRNMSANAVAEDALAALGRDATLLENVLDDGVETK